MPLLDLFWTMLWLFLFIMWIWLLISIFSDIFRREMSGWAKAGWVFFLIVSLTWLFAAGLGALPYDACTGPIPYPQDQRYDDNLSLTYTTSPLQDAVEVTGRPTVRKGVVRLKDDIAHRIWLGHPFVYKEAIDAKKSLGDQGSSVDVVDFEGSFVGRGIIDGNSAIAELTSRSSCRIRTMSQS